MRAIEVCRTAVLGGHKDKCDHCGHLEISYSSCRNRHCPKCQTLRKEKWIEAHSEDLLPIEYLQTFFTSDKILKNHAIIWFGQLVRLRSDVLFCDDLTSKGHLTRAITDMVPAFVNRATS